jgi:two-component system chemotaxis response regulator CheB
MPATFTTSFAARLDARCAPTIREAEHDEPLKPGHVYIAPGGLRHLMIRGEQAPHCRLIDANPVTGHRPSVDVLFRSVSQSVGKRAVGVLLTGMGRDGAAGLLEMREAGCRTIGQNEASCVVYGMPRAAFETGAVEDVLPIDRIAERVLDLCSQ